MLSRQAPNVLAESVELAKAATEGTLTPEVIMNNEAAVTAMRNGEVNSGYLRTMRGLPFYVAHTAPQEDSSAIAFDRHFNPSLKHDSDYFSALNSMISCVERNAGKSTVEE